MSIATIKANIKTHLDALVTAETLGSAMVSDLRTDPLNQDIGAFPAAFLMPPAVESEPLDNRTNTRTYTFDVVILFKAENITGTAEVEIAVEEMLTEFDNDPTLSGAANGGMSPVASSPEPFQHQHGQMIMVVLQLKATEDVTLTF